MSNNNTTYEQAMKVLNLEKELAYKTNLEYSTLEERENTLRNLRSEIAELTKSSNDAEPYEEWNSEAIPESAPESLSESLSESLPVPFTQTASVPEPTSAAVPQPPPPRNRRSLQDVYAGLAELYKWLLDQPPATAMSLGASLGFLHGCIWCLLFPRFVSFLLFLFASSLATLGILAYRDVDMTPRQRDSITVCYGFFGIIAALMLTIWLSY